MAIELAASRPKSRPRFYFWFALLFALNSVLSFIPTYWQPLLGGRLEGGGTALHVHAFLFTAWPLLFLAQTWLAAHSHLKAHRKLGIVAAATAFAMVLTGLWVTASSIDLQSTVADPFQARAFGIVSFTKIVFFAVCVTIALANVRKPDLHKRLMVVAMFPLVLTAIPRVFYVLFMPPGSPQRPGLGEPLSLASRVALVPGLVTDLLLVGVVVLLDRRSTGRVHASYIAGGVALVAIHFLQVPLSTTDAWQSFAIWLAALAR